jgi:hypothetical protein
LCADGAKSREVVLSSYGICHLEQNRLDAMKKLEELKQSAASKGQGQAAKPTTEGDETDYGMRQ